MSDLVERLRRAEEQTPLDLNEQHLQELCGKSADEIERLRADCKEKDRLIETQKQYLDNKDSVIKGMNEMVKKLETGTLNKDSAIQG